MMGFLASGIFWGSLLILWGASIILNAVFHLNIPFFRIAFALIVIWFGLRILLGGRCCGGGRAAVFSESTFKGDKAPGDYNIVFGKGDIDLTGLKIDKPTRIEVNVVFGNGTLKLPAKTPFRIKANAVFGNAQLPDGKVISFGDSVYESKGAEGSANVLDIQANVVFGRLEATTE